ncbi:DNA ligase [Photobacterium galatheae]|uniref:DNA ligase n=1 Tax=Photobacterium galatheae TaxID=1654360 RepID=UPI00202CE6B1|nr:DNA ligase [Photobacterium galatheae]MCM0148853.1 DNA ligase [Photobacterium galatheae]
MMKYSALAIMITMALSPQLQTKESTATMHAHAIHWQDDTFVLPEDNVISDYWVSEKLDGVRAFWTGNQLQTRSGHRIHAPEWFTKDLPQEALDGELWAGRNHFYHVTQTVLDTIPNDTQWQKIQFMVFDAPSHPGSFDERLNHLTTLINTLPLQHIEIVEQKRLNTIQALENWLDEVESRGGEGLMLHQASQRYVTGRTNGLLKLKRFQDAEAIVIGYEPGKGKYEGRTGAIWVKMDKHPLFKIGSGLSDAERAAPPPIGSIVTFRYNGFTQNRIPRFARYLRTRPSKTL